MQFIARERAKQAAWQFLLDFKPGQKALILEAGAGSVCMALSRRYREVVLMQDNPDTLLDVTHRCAKADLNNIVFVCSSFLLGLPLPNATFDCIVLHDISTLLSPCGGIKPASLRRLLSEAKRVLKSDGTLVVTGDNKSLLLWIRSKLKRLKAFVIGRKRPQGPPSAQGFHQLDTLMRDIGFQHQDLVSITPRLIPFRQAALLSQVLTPFQARIKQSMSPAFAIIATPKGPRISFLNRFSEIVLDHLGGGEIQSLKYLAGNPDSVILLYNVQPLSPQRPTGVTTPAGDVRSLPRVGGAVARLPLTTISLARCQRNYDALHTLSEKPTVLSGLVPRVVGKGEFCGQSYFIESLIPGCVITSPKPASLGRIVNESAFLLTAFHNETAQRRVIDAIEFSRVASPLIEGILPYIKLEEARTCFNDMIDVIRERLLGSALPFVLSHGDFQADNMIISPDTLRIHGVIDWDISGDSALPLLDLLYLFSYKETMLGRGDFNDVFLRKILPLNLNEEEMPLFSTYQSVMGISSDQTLPLLIFFWLHHVVFRLEPLWRQFSGWMNRCFYPILFKVHEAVQREKVTS